jgi:hypothetical protein
MNFQLSSVFAVSIIVIGNCASNDVLDRSLRDTLRQQLDNYKSQVGTYFQIIFTRVMLNYMAHLKDLIHVSYCKRSGLLVEETRVPGENHRRMSLTNFITQCCIACTSP